MNALVDQLAAALSLPSTSIKVTSVYDGSIVVVVSVPVSSVSTLQAAIINGFFAVFNSQTFNVIPNSFAPLSTTTTTISVFMKGPSGGSSGNVIQGSSSSGSTGPIVGGVVGGVLLLVVIVVIIYVRRRGHGSKPGPISIVGNSRSSLVGTNHLADLQQAQSTSTSARIVHLHNNPLDREDSETHVDEGPLSPNTLFGEVPLAAFNIYGELPIASNTKDGSRLVAFFR